MTRMSTLGEAGTLPETIGQRSSESIGGRADAAAHGSSAATPASPRKVAYHCKHQRESGKRRRTLQTVCDEIQ